MSKILPHNNNVFGPCSFPVGVKTLFQYFFISKNDNMLSVSLCGISVVRRGGHGATELNYW